MTADLPYLYLFWAIIFVIGLINLPLTFFLFKNFADRGYIFAKISGIALISFSVWLLSFLKILPFTKISIGITAFLLFMVNVFLYHKTKKISDYRVNAKTLKLIFFEEFLFLFFFVFWSYIRGFAPEIHGLEKFMDFGFINSILRTRFMPPLDMWLAPSLEYPYHFINYYYFGHFTTALLTKISFIPPEITYNLMLGVICSFCFTGSFSIAFNLFSFFEKQRQKAGELLYSWRALFCGVLAGFLVTFGGNLHTIYVFTKGYPMDSPKPFWQLLGSPNPGAYWYPNATRFIKNTIHEFPSYSFIVSDLHGHVLDIPFVLLTIAFLFSILISAKSDNIYKLKTLACWSSRQNSKLKSKTQILKLFGSRNSKSGFDIYDLRFEILLLGLLLAVMYMTNAWDGIIYLGLAGLVLLIINTKLKNNKEPSQPEIQNLIPIKSGQNYSLKLKIIDKEISFEFLNFIFIFSFLLFTFFLFSFPFNRHFIPFAKGIGLNCFTPNANGQVLCDHSPIWMLAILWGHFFYFSASFILFTVIPAIKNNPSNRLNLKLNLTISDVFTVLLILISTLLLIAPEFIFARDIYPVHYRANTMFKLGYQAFIMLGIAISFIIFRFLTIPFQIETRKVASPLRKITLKVAKTGWWFFALIQLFLVSIYPFFGINSYYNGLKEYKNLDGLKWLGDVYPQDMEIINYFRKNLGEFDQPVILEAVGDSYTDYARISAYTGLPTVVGWPVHEWLWRGSYDEAGKRTEEVRKIYQSDSFFEMTKLLTKYNVRYLIISTLEQQKYSKIREDNFAKFGEIVFQSGSSKIYKIDFQNKNGKTVF